MDKVIDSQVLRAFELFKEKGDIPSDYQLCTELELNRSVFSKWKTGKTKVIKHSLWKDLEPKLKPYLKEAQQEDFSNIFNNLECKISLPVNDDLDRKHLGNLIKDINNNLNLFLKEKRDQNRAEKKKHAIRFPHLTEKVAAGTGVHQDFEAYGDRPDLAIMDVEGESMSPTYEAGEKVVIHLFQEPVIFGTDFLPMYMVKALIPEDSIIIFERNGDGQSMKRVKYDEGKNTWYLKLTADNKKWAKEEKFRRIIRKGEEFKIIGTVLGRLN